MCFEPTFAPADLSAFPNQTAANLLRFDAAIVLHRDPIILFAAISLGALVSFRISPPSNIGIIVQKVVAPRACWDARARASLHRTRAPGSFPAGRGPCPLEPQG
jgi:hypothetical protein